MKVLFILIPLLLLLGSVVTLCLAKFSKLFAKSREGVNSKKNKMVSIVSIVVTIVSFLVLLFIPGSIHQVDAGEVAVVKVWGDAKETRTAGIHFDFWISKTYEVYDAKVQQCVVETEAYSSDGQTMDIELVIQYQIQRNNVIMIAKNYGGLDMLENRISTVATEKMKSVLSKKSAMTIIETRSEVSAAVEENIRNAITSDYYVDITTVVLTDVSFTETFEKTIEDKMIAEQEKLKAEYEKEKAIIQAEQAFEVAKLEANAKLAAAEGDAKAKETIAQAEANAIKIKAVEAARFVGLTVTETTTEEGTLYTVDYTSATAEQTKLITEYMEYIAYLEKWDGKFPEVMTDSNAQILIPTNPTV